jgi:hypothetical protein
MAKTEMQMPKRSSPRSGDGLPALEQMESKPDAKVSVLR